MTLAVSINFSIQGNTMSLWEVRFGISGLTTLQKSGIDELKFDERLLMRYSKKYGQFITHLLIVNDGNEYEIFNNAEKRILDVCKFISLSIATGPIPEYFGMKKIQTINDFALDEDRISTQTKAVRTKEECAGILKKMADELPAQYLRVEKKINKYLHTALDYFYYAEKSDRLEEKIIDYFICIESLIGENIEITHRIANRATTLLSVVFPRMPPLEIKENMIKFYSIRSKIVHGSRIKVGDSTVIEIRNYTKKLLQIFLLSNASLSRDAWLKLIDAALFDNKKKKGLKKIIPKDIIE
jgi:hypothetical protein